MVGRVLTSEGGTKQRIPPRKPEEAGHCLQGPLFKVSRKGQSWSKVMILAFIQIPILKKKPWKKYVATCRVMSPGVGGYLVEPRNLILFVSCF